MSAPAADASERAQHEQRCHSDRDQREYPYPVNKQLAFTVAKECAERHQSAAGKDYQRALHRIECADAHGEAADTDEDGRPQAASVGSFHRRHSDTRCEDARIENSSGSIENVNVSSRKSVSIEFSFPIALNFRRLQMNSRRMVLGQNDSFAGARPEGV